MPLPPPGPARRPREAITEDALSVHPTLIGLPLAHPWRRFFAIAIDGTLVLLLTQAPGVLFAIAAALVLFRASTKRSAGGGYVRQSLRLGFRVAGAVTLFVVALATWDNARDRIASGFGSSDASISASAGGSTVQMGAGDGMRVGADIIGFRQARDRAAAARSGASALERMRDEGMDDDAIEATLEAIAESNPEKPWLALVVDSLFGGTAVAPERPADRDSLSLAYAAAVAANDSAAAEALRPRVSEAWSADTAAALSERMADLEEESAGLRTQLDEIRESEENRSVVQRLRSIADDLGLGLGWIGLYFTSTLALWQGKTPGKRLLGIRVIRLNGKPIGWWAAFERFGGYAAGFATGLLGFAQILWDRNRQAIHDKITETAVIRG